MSKDDLKELLYRIQQGELIAATLSSPLKSEKNEIIKISIRPVIIKFKKTYQISLHDQQKVIHKNLDLERGASFIEETFPRFSQSVLTLVDCQYHLLMSKHHKMTILKKETKPNSISILHNRKKSYLLQEGLPIPFLVALGVMASDGKVIAKKYDKFRQINRFLEMVRDVTEALPRDRCLKIVDFGCGKAYLTFALHHYLHVIEKRDVQIEGLDLKNEAISQCQKLAQQLDLKGLNFSVGDINDFQTDEDVDLMISLHACDTATDAALEKAIRWNTQVILCVPCCQHELYSQVHHIQLNTLFRHGILKERMAALVTDAARADLLTILGYDVQILEFIDMDHTPKNLLLRAVKGVSQEKRQLALDRYQHFKAALNITPSLEKRFSHELGFKPRLAP